MITKDTLLEPVVKNNRLGYQCCQPLGYFGKIKKYWQFFVVDKLRLGSYVKLILLSTWIAKMLDSWQHCIKRSEQKCAIKE